MLKPFPLHWCLQYDWMWLNKTFIQVKLFFICGIVCSIPFWYHLCYHFLSQWWQLNGCSKMRSQVVLLDEFFITVVAVEWFSPVWSLSSTLRSSFWMNFLSQWWQLNGCPQMRSQAVPLDDFLITVVEVEWFFTSVKPFMHSQVVFLDEFLVTVDL